MTNVHFLIYSLLLCNICLFYIPRLSKLLRLQLGMHTSKQNVRSNENFNLFIAPQSSTQQLNPLFTLESCTTPTPSIQTTTRSLPNKLRAPVSRQDVSEQTTPRQETTDKGGSLLSRLKQEAEGIRKWQTSVDMELKNKSEHIREMTSLIEEQRKSLLEVQLEYEKVSGLLQEERGNQEQLGKQLVYTRDLFSAVKENVERVEEEVKRSGDDNNDISFFQQQLITRYEELRENYLLLQSRCQDVIKELQTELRLSKDECSEVKKKNNVLIEETARLNEDICNKTQVFEDSLGNLSSDLCQKETAYCALTKEKNDLRSQFSVTQGELEGLTVKHRELGRELTEREVELKNGTEQTELLQNRCNELTADLDEASNAKYSMQLLNSSLHREVSELEGQHVQLKDELTTCGIKLANTCTELAIKDRELLSERDNLNEVRERVFELEREVIAKDETLDSNSNKISTMSTKLKESGEERVELKKQVMQLQEALSSLSEESEDIKSVLSIEISKQKYSITQVERERDETEKMLAISETMNNKLSLEVGQSVKTCEELQNHLNKKTEEAEVQLSHLKTAQLQISQLSLTIEQLTATVEAMKLEKIELVVSHSEKLSLLESQRLENQTSHSEEISKLQNSNQFLRLSVETMEKKHNLELETKDRDMELLLREKQNFEDELKYLKERVSCHQQQLEKANTRATEGEEEAKQRVSEMLDSLCKYRKESSEILSAKNREIEDLKLKQANEMKEEMNKATTRFNEELRLITSEKEKLESTLEDIQRERKQELSAKRLAVSTPKRTNDTATLSQVRTPCNTEELPNRTPRRREVKQTPKNTQIENETEKRVSRNSVVDKNFRTPSIHASSNLKQKRKKIRLDDVSMEILNSQDDYLSPRNPTSLKLGPSRQNSTPISGKENLPSYLRDAPPTPTYSRTKAKTRSAKSKSSKEYNWFDSDTVFGLGADD